MIPMWGAGCTWTLNILFISNMLHRQLLLVSTQHHTAPQHHRTEHTLQSHHLTLLLCRYIQWGVGAGERMEVIDRVSPPPSKNQKAKGRQGGEQNYNKEVVTWWYRRVFKMIVFLK
jgi:hypothetical protein